MTSRNALGELPREQAINLTAAFIVARKRWGSRAAYARHVGVNESTVQILEGRRGGPLSDDMIERLTSPLFGPGNWRLVAKEGPTSLDEAIEIRVADDARARRTRITDEDRQSEQDAVNDEMYKTNDAVVSLAVLSSVRTLRGDDEGAQRISDFAQTLLAEAREHRQQYLAKLERHMQYLRRQTNSAENRLRDLQNREDGGEDGRQSAPIADLIEHRAKERPPDQLAAGEGEVEPPYPEGD